VTAERWQRFTGKAAELDGVDQTFDDLKARANKQYTAAWRGARRRPGAVAVGSQFC
jgi:hypothetical protein